MPYDIKVTARSENYSLPVLTKQVAGLFHSVVAVRYASCQSLIVARGTKKDELTGLGLMALETRNSSAETFSKLGLHSNQSFNLRKGQVLIEYNLSKSLSRSLGQISIGDQLQLLFPASNGTSHIRLYVAGFFRVEKQRCKVDEKQKLGIGFFAPSPGFIVASQTANGTTNLVPWGPSTALCFLGERAIDPQNVASSLSNLDEVVFEIERRTSCLAEVENVLGRAVEQRLSGLPNLRKFYVSAGLPILLLGGLLGLLGLELVQISFSREVCSLTCRGASRSQVLAVFSAQGGILGAFGGALGAALGPVFLPLLLLPPGTPLRALVGSLVPRAQH